MKSPDYAVSIEVPSSPHVVFTHITDVSKWWSKGFEGQSKKLNDEFIISHNGKHYSKQRLIEVVPDSRIVWLVTESNLNWLEKDKLEWTNTKMVFELIPKGDKTLLNFTHEGLSPEKECYARCSQGWHMIITDWLYHFITDREWELK